jgi:hypothetical protein
MACPCKLHRLNPWIESCPYCGTANPNYTTELTPEDAEFKDSMERLMDENSPQAQLSKLLG